VVVDKAVSSTLHNHNQTQSNNKFKKSVTLAMIAKRNNQYGHNAENADALSPFQNEKLSKTARRAILGDADVNRHAITY